MAKELVSRNEYGLFATKDGTVMINSVDVAQVFKKTHYNVLQDIRKLIEETPEFGGLNFQASTYTSTQHKSLPCYDMTRDGFTLLAMGYNGKEAMAFKIAYIQRFNEMENFIKTLNQARLDFPALTDRIHEMHENPQHYHYSNEINMIYKIAIGMTASEFRKVHNLAEHENIRSHLTNEQIVLVVWLQQLDCALSYTITDYHERKATLQKIVTEQQPPKSLMKRLTCDKQ